MLLDLAQYLLLIAVLVAAVWAAGRLLAPRSGGRGGVGSPAVDAEYDFDRIWARHRRHQLAAALRGRRQDLALPLIEDAAPVELLSRRYLGEHVIPLQRVIGSVDGGARKFDRDFLPTDKRSRARLEAILVAMREGEPVPPIEVFGLHGNYYVCDGHHRVAAARALGDDYIAARVTELSSPQARS